MQKGNSKPHLTNLSTRNRRVAVLLVGDLAALLLFALIGRRSHGAAVGFAATVETLRTAAPFLAGWLLVAPWVGAYRLALFAHPPTLLRTTLLGWAGALLVGAIFRAAMIGRFSPLSFYLVTFFVALLLLLGWRATFFVLTRPRS